MPKDDESKTTTNWVDLPIDITSNILKRLDTVQIVTSACLVCPLWWNICKDPLMWRTIHINHVYYCKQYNSIQLMEICRYAIKRCCGYLEEIDIEDFGTDDLLQFIADNNSSNLRCMRLSICNEISDRGFCEAVRKFPHLEELYISRLYLSQYSLHIICQSCTLLKSLTFTRYHLIRDYEDEDDEALIISRTLPKLCSLNISKNLLTNDGLVAILDGCPLLESLDISGCYNIILTYSLNKRCCEKIKDLKLPYQNSYYEEDEDDYEDDHFVYKNAYLAEKKGEFYYDKRLRFLKGI